MMRRAALQDDDRTAALLGAALGVAFSACFATGLLSHLIQSPPAWFMWTTRPAGLYRVTQGLHVITGIAAIPLVLAKLWVVYPKLFRRPPFESVAHALERVSLLPLVGGAMFLLFSGVANIYGWYPWEFSFRSAHYWVAWMTIGALVVHIGAKWTTTRRVLSRATPDTAAAGTLDRRGFVALTLGASGLLALLTAGQTVRPLERLALLAPRRPSSGPQGFPVNRTAEEAGVTDAIAAPGYRLIVDGAVEHPLQLSMGDLERIPQFDAVLPIACVEGWSASKRWRGVRVGDLLDMAGADSGATARVHSMQEHGAFASSELNRWQVRDRDTLLALQVEGETLHPDHGYPLRLIGPNRPGVQQTKWVERLEVL